MSNQQTGRGKKNESALPDFMSEKAKVNYTEELEAKSSWLNNNLNKLMIWFSVLWFVIVLVYITQFFGWSNLFLMMPDEFGGFLAGVTLPLAIIWVVMAYIDRGSSFKNEAKFLRAYMNQLVYPEDGGAQTAKAMADAIRSQVIELHQATKHATEQTDAIKKELGNRVEDFSKLISTLDNYSAKTMVELTECVKTLSKNFDDIISRAGKSTAELKEYIDGFVQSAGTMESNYSHLLNTIVPHIQEMRESADVLNNINNNSSAQMEKSCALLREFGDSAAQNTLRISEVISRNTENLEQAAERAVSACDTLYGKIDGGIGRLDDLLKAQGSYVNTQLEKMENNVSALSGSFKEQGAVLDKELNRIVKNSGQLVDEQIAKVEKTISYMSGKFDEHQQKVARELEKAVQKSEDYISEQINRVSDHMADLGEAFEDHNRNLSQEVEKIISRAGIAEESISVQVNELEGISDRIQESLKEINNNMEDNIAGLDKKTAAIMATMDNIVQAGENSENRLTEITGKAAERMGALTEELVSKNSALQKISEEAVLSLRQAGQELGANSLTLREQSDAARLKLEEIGDVVKKHTDNLTEASSLVVTQSKVSETALAQQQKSISASFAKVDSFKAELKSQIDELNRTASQLSENAVDTIGSLKKQIVEALDICENMVTRTQVVNDNLIQQSGRFENSAETALNKVVQMDGILTGKTKMLDEISQLVEKRGDNVADLLEKQIVNINAATLRSDSKFKEITELFDKQSDIISSTAENTAAYVGNVIQVLDEKAENINLIFKQQENEFTGICDRLAENTASMGNTLKKQVSVIEQNADKVFARMTLLEEDVNNRVESVASSTTKAIDRLSEVNKSIAAQNNDVSKFIKEITDKMGMISASFRDNFQIFNNTVSDVTNRSDSFTNTVVDNCNKIKNANKDMALESKNLNAILEEQYKNVDQALGKIVSQSELVKENFDHQKDSLADVANILATQSRLGEASLAQQYKYLSDAATEVSNKLSEINAKFKGNTDDIFEAAAKLSYEFNVLGDRLIKVNDDINKSSKNTIKNIEQVNMSLSQSVDDLTAGVNASTAKLNGVMKDYDKHIADFNTITAEASTGVVEINNLIEEQSDKMIKISEDTKQLVECFNTVLNDTSIQLSNRANMAFEKVKGLGENLKLLSTQIEEETKISSMHLEKSGSQLRSSISEIAANAERISNEIRSSGEVFLKQSGVLVAATDDTVKKVTDVMGILDNSAAQFTAHGDEMIKKSINFNEVINKQLKTLLDTTQKTDGKLTDMEKRYENITVDSFLKDASNIIEQLETISVDINRIFNPSTEEELWKKYYNGDTAAFVRHLAKTMTKQQVLSIRGKFEKDLDFRNLVTHYLSEFETLITRARNNERSGILLSVISGADIGKVYYILAKSLDKIN